MLGGNGHAAVVVRAAVEDVAGAGVSDAEKRIVGCGLLGSATEGCALGHAVEARSEERRVGKECRP